MSTKSWDGATFCEEPCREDGKTHLHCDGPLPGQWVTYRRKGEKEIHAGRIRIHWHYEGCMIDVEGQDRALVPDLGDEVWSAKA